MRFHASSCGIGGGSALIRIIRTYNANNKRTSVPGGTVADIEAFLYRRSYLGDAIEAVLPNSRAGPFNSPRRFRIEIQKNQNCLD